MQVRPRLGNTWTTTQANSYSTDPDICDVDPVEARVMYAVEIPSGHVAMVSHPDDVAKLIKTAVQAVQAAS